MEKLIITAALTGGVTVPTQTPYLPYTPQQIIDQAVECAEAGAASPRKNHPQRSSGMKKKGKKDEKKTPKKGK